MAYTDVVRTRLINQATYGMSDLEEGVPALYDDMILSLLSEPRFLAVVYAAQPSRAFSTTGGDEDTLYPCERRHPTNRFRYDVINLWCVYAVAILFALVAVFFGAVAVRKEGVTRSMNFTAIAQATQGNAALRSALASHSGGAPGDPDVRVGYGLLVSNGQENLGFGVEGDVMQGARRRMYRVDDSDG
jgi:hypothetical protein